MFARTCVLFLLAAQATADSERMSVNPIRRVVTLLQNIQKKVEAEGDRDAKLFEKYECYCQNGAKDLDASIGAADTKIPQVENSIKEGKAQKAQLEADLEKAKSDRSAAKEAIAKATALREKEAATYAKTSSDYKQNIAAMGSAITAIEKGVVGFVQTAAANTLRRLTIEMDLSEVDRDVLSSFLSQDASSSYAPQSGQIVGILKQMKSTMESDLADATAAEETAKANFEALVAAKSKEIEANTAAIEHKTQRHGELSVEIVNMEEDLHDTQKARAADKAFLADLDKNCATKKEEYEVVKKTRSEELLAIHETIQLLNDDDALDLFKKTLPTPSLLQTKVAAAETKQAVMDALHGVKDSRINLIMMSMHGRKVNFDKVLKMCDDMVLLLGKEQADDDEKKAYCEANLDKSEDEHKQLEQNIADLDKAIDDTKNLIQTLTDEIDALNAGVKALDKSVADATETRKAEHEEYVQNMAADNAAKDLLGLALNRLNKFYNRALYVEPSKRELSREQRITVEMGGTLAPTAAPGGIAGTGITALDQVAPPPPPEAVPAYQKKGQETNGVTAMIDMLIADLDKEMQEMTVNEKDAQSEYEAFMSDSKNKRADDTKSIADKQGAKADAEANLEKATEDRKNTLKAAMDMAEHISALHGECDWLISNFQARKDARAGEVSSLKNAKAVLSGADYSFAQMQDIHRH